MKLDRIGLKNYRNIENMEISPCKGINVIYGDNAQGKTNLIEAIWLFSGNNSFRGAKTNELIMFDKEFVTLDADYSDNIRTQKARITIAQKKRIFLNNIEMKTSYEFKQNSNFYAVVFSPSHLSFIKDGPKNRRKFIDIAVSQIKPQYEEYLNRYEKLVEQRNSLLKSASNYEKFPENIDLWDIQLAKIGTIISIYRTDYIKKLEILAKKIYEGLSSCRESFYLNYNSTIFENVKELKNYDDFSVDLYYKKLKETVLSDLKQGYTSCGIHRDDLDVFIDNKSVKIYGSQGQQRSAVIALKLAEAELLKKVTGENPIMLLDDVMSELDVKRQDYILNHVLDMQVFITCCDISNTLKLKNGSVFKIHNGIAENILIKEIPRKD